MLDQWGTGCLLTSVVLGFILQEGSSFSDVKKSSMEGTS